MNKQYIPYKASKRLVLFGFKEKCFDLYGDNLGCGKLITKFRKRTPKILWQQAFDFFREKFFLSGEVYHFNGKWSYDIENILTGFNEANIENEIDFNVARLACLNNLIEIVKKLKYQYFDGHNYYTNYSTEENPDRWSINLAHFYTEDSLINKGYSRIYNIKA